MLNYMLTPELLTVQHHHTVNTISVTHPNYSTVLAMLRGHPDLDNPDQAFLDNLDTLMSQKMMQSASAQMHQLSERVSYNETTHTLLFDDEPLDSALTQHILNILRSPESDIDDWEPLVLFLERTQLNPSMRTRSGLYEWLKKEGLTLWHDGRVVGYKGLSDTSESIQSGTASVNGSVMTGTIPNNVGSVISMPADQVDDDTRIACSLGLHIGTSDFAMSFGGSLIATVVFAPEHVVSLPEDAHIHKLRCSEYEVLAVQKKDHFNHHGRNAVLTGLSIEEANSAEDDDDLLDDVFDGFDDDDDEDYDDPAVTDFTTK